MPQADEEEGGSANPTAANCLHLNNGHVRVVRLTIVLTKLDTKINSLSREEVEKQLIYWLNVNNSSARVESES